MTRIIPSASAPHHSRFLQVADLLVYMAGRYENRDDIPERWHEQEVKGVEKDKGQRECAHSTLALRNLERLGPEGTARIETSALVADETIAQLCCSRQLPGTKKVLIGF